MEITKFAEILKAMGHPTRMKIVEHLININSCMCGDIVDIFSYSQSTISQHLKLLTKSGLVHSETQGPKTFFSIDKQILRQLKKHVEEMWLSTPIRPPNHMGFYIIILNRTIVVDTMAFPFFSWDLNESTIMQRPYLKQTISSGELSSNNSFEVQS